MKTFNVPQFCNGFCCYFKSTCLSFDKVIKLFTLTCLHPSIKALRKDNVESTTNISMQIDYLFLTMSHECHEPNCEWTLGLNVKIFAIFSQAGFLFISCL